MDKDEWICKICDRKIGTINRIITAFFGLWNLRLWYQTDGGKVHRWCYNKPRKKVKNSELKFAF